jgi:hypothetical protein
MDPYLENPGLWPDAHARLIAVIGEVLGAMLRPKYLVRIEERTDPIDESGQARERFLKVIDPQDRTVIAVIEVLSPANKAAGSRGLASFVQKRREIMTSQAHWVEIDLLHGGVAPAFRRGHEPHEYMVHISPVSLRPRGLLWPIRLSQALPTIRIPLRPDDPDVTLNLQGVLNTVYERAGYDLEIDYRAEPHPPLGPAWTSWADGLLRKKDLRTT